MAREVAIKFRGFPQEVWFLIAEQVANSDERSTLSTLLLLARLNNAMACFALPLVYGIPYGPRPDKLSHRLYKYVRADKQSVSFWRSIIVSSLGRTIYPYCCWINKLDFYDLFWFLGEMIGSKDAHLRQRFYSPPLRYLELLKTEIPEYGYNLFCEVVSKITEGIKATIDQGRVTSRLAEVRWMNVLGGFNSLPTGQFGVWNSRFTGLRSFYIHDMGLLNEQASVAISRNCPCLKQL